MLNALLLQPLLDWKAQRRDEMSRAQLAILPVPDGRTAVRRVVNLAAELRELGAWFAEVEVVDLSTDGFMAEVDSTLEVGVHAWLKLPGLTPLNCRVVWSEGGKAGFEFASPVHASAIDQLIASNRKPLRKGHFGPQ